jgi:hypothetical protein
MLEAPPAKMAKLEDVVVAKVDADDVDAAWDAVAQRCIKNLEAVVARFPQHFKAIHLGPML